MKVSVAIISYNHEQFIRQTLDSVLAQQLPFPWEIVVGEDKSTDGTRRIIQEFADRHPGRFRLLLGEQNIGAGPNLKRVLEACTGEYVALVEGDDFWTSPEKLRRQVEFLDAEREAVLCHHRVTAFEHPSGKTLYEFPPAEFRQRIVKQERIMERNFIQTCSVMFRRSATPELDAGFFGLTVGDWPLFALLSRHGSIGYQDDNMAHYRVHAAGLWSCKPGWWQSQELLRVQSYLQRRFHPDYADFFRGSITAAYNYDVHSLARAGDYRKARAKIREWLRWCRSCNCRPARTILGTALMVYSPRLWRMLGSPGILPLKLHDCSSGGVKSKTSSFD